MAYSSNQKPDGLETLTDSTIADTDIAVVGDTSDSGRVKGITWANTKLAIKTYIEGLASYFNVSTGTSDDITEGTTNLFFTSAEQTKLSGIETSADVTDETNVKAALDGATVTNATVAATDKILFQDASDSDNLKQDDAQTLANLATPEGTAIKSTGETGGSKYLREDGDGTCSWQAVAGGGDMSAATYDPTSVAGDAFDMDNMVEGATTKILTDTERTAIATNSAKVGVTTEISNVVEDTTPQLGGTLDLNSKDITDGTTFKYDSANSRLSIGTTDNTISIAGATALGVNFTSETEGATDLVDFFTHRHSDTAAFGSHILTARSRGTHASPTVVQSGDKLSLISGLGFDGTDFELAASIDVEVDGTPGANDMPGRIIFKTTPDGSNIPAEAMRISQDKAITMAGTLAVTGAASASNLSGTNTGDEAAASTTVSGIVELAIASEVNTGTDATRAVTPDSLAGSNFGIRYVQVTCFDYTTDTATGDGKGYIHIPAGMDGMNLVEVHAEVITAGTTGTTDIQIHNVDNALDMLSTKLTIDSAETGSDTAATPAVINTSNDHINTNDVLRIDVDAVSTTAAQGLIVTLGFNLP